MDMGVESSAIVTMIIGGELCYIMTHWGDQAGDGLYMVDIVTLLNQVVLWNSNSNGSSISICCG